MIDKIDQWLKNKEKEFTEDLSGMTLLESIEVLDSIRITIWILATVVWIICGIQVFVPFPNLNFTIINIVLWVVLAVLLIGSSLINWLMILFTTRRLDKNEDERVKINWNYLQNFFWQVSYIIGCVVAVPLCFIAMPFLQFLRLHPSMKGWTYKMTDKVAGDPIVNRLLLFGAAIIAVFYLHARFKHLSDLFKARIQEWMKSYEFRYKPLHDMLSGKSQKDLAKSKNEPYMVLGESLITGDDVYQTPASRRQNSVIFGPIGAGKTSTWFIPQMSQDVRKFILYLRTYPKRALDKDWNKPYGDQQNFLSGFGVIEPTNDLCRNIYEIAISMGVPKDRIIWFDPENPQTPSLNLMDGPVEAVNQTLTDIITGLKKNADDFFSKTERMHFTQHIYLLKYASIIEGKAATFGDLVKMYNDVYVVVEKREELRQYVSILEDKLEETRDKIERLQQEGGNREEIEKLENNIKELDSKYKISSETLSWFDNNIISPQFKDGVKIQQSGPHAGEPVYQDTQRENITGLINQLIEMSKKRGLRRVLFGKSNFSLDDAMKNGYILLCNTSKDTLGAISAKMLGQIYILAIQAATFRRKANVDPMFPIYMDEFPDYLTADFTDFAAQARKYNVPLNIAAQSPAQLSLKNGPDYLRAVFSVMLTRATFGDMGAEDAETLSALFGTHKVTEESLQNQEIDLAANSTKNQTRISSQTTEVPNITPDEIMGLEKFTIAVRTPGDHKSLIFDRIKVHRVSMEKIENDENNFDLNKPKDKQAYEELNRIAQHTNAEYDEIDKEIIEDLKVGKIEKNKPEQSSNNVQTVKDEKDEMVKKVGVGKLPGKIESSKSETTLIEEGGDPFELEGNVITSSKSPDRDETISDDQLTIEAAKEAAENSVFKSPNGGNGRYDNKIETDYDSSPDLKKISNIKTDSKPTVSVTKVKEPKEKDINSKRSESSAEIKHNAIVKMKNGFNTIYHNENLSQTEKIKRLKEYAKEQREALSPIFPKDIDIIMEKLNGRISKLEDKDKKDNFTPIEVKPKTPHNFNQELNNLMKNYGDGPLPSNQSQKNFEPETSFDDKDPFNNQPGMISHND
ncbi:type IV secretory system conjugative DNA transfer family protein [Lactobacillus taiwanensis]|uniref:type IV secretory system conjugative DNA transfer family protein n=1 Tax=Lactobacillus taiwanensis TaxID=508451 RepID=UPI001AEC3CB8|nr:TraM recognition domain-containing protein [Lactobacillus taiwanensis]QTQ40870.1 TraM recognition domain-containing protein [Lactobacillus taiwanensis]